MKKLIIWLNCRNIQKRHLESFVYLLQFYVHKNTNHPKEFDFYHSNLPVCKSEVSKYLSLTEIIKWDTLTISEFEKVYDLYQNLDKFISVLRNSSPWLSSKFGEKMEF
jgi:hypothetical protein